ncbi:ParB/RepB/Spo0J family partition protein [Vibrio sp. S4M6]|uniref:ParB/RepB/Spo0J family partition protein n=1 Tax=Vibrio sinus TaxID=2946865 RepID=UPI00202A832F|nr:ParB/RepB/Spo0J family partition protein [Vibrio sinus]MCL9783681.1 ParB/RepB/Spo0J family partition protein [Vibrio sinus]
MRNDIDIKAKPTSVSVQAVKRQKKGKLSAGDTMTKHVLSAEVTFKLVEIAPEHIEKRTMVFLENERDQELLDVFAISDIADSYQEHGQEFPAIGREVAGVIEIAEGSRRRFSSIHFKKPYFIWVGGLNDNQMRHLSDVGNQYKGVSAYEKGSRYRKILARCGNQEKAAEELKLSRRMLMKYINTAKLPKLFIQCFASPNDLSVNEGERLYKLMDKANQQKKERLEDEMQSWWIEKEERKYSAEDLVTMFANVLAETKSDKVKPRELAMGATVTMKNGNATIKIPKISDDSRKKIEEFIEQTLSKEALDNC